MNLPLFKVRLSLNAIVGMLFFSGVAHSAEVREGRCHMGSCSWYSIEETDLIASSTKGALFKVATRWWSSSHPDNDYGKRARRTGGAIGTSYVLCSKTSPAILSQDGTKWEVHRLSPGHSDAVFGATESAYRWYWATCHQVTASDPYNDTERLARRFGYKVPEGAVDGSINEPQDILR